MESTQGVVDVDDILVAPERKAVFRVDRTKAALHANKRTGRSPRLSRER